MVSALTAFHQGIAVAHVEAGLRTGDPGDPFPEEMNRKVISSLASWHFAPTRGAARNLKNEGVPSSRIAVTGNTVIDALAMMDKILVDRPLPLRLKPESRLVLVTAHRRESFGRPLDNICSGSDRYRPNASRRRDRLPRPSQSKRPGSRPGPAFGTGANPPDPAPRLFRIPPSLEKSLPRSYRFRRHPGRSAVFS